MFSDKSISGLFGRRIKYCQISFQFIRTCYIGNSIIFFLCEKRYKELLFFINQWRCSIYFKVSCLLPMTYEEGENILLITNRICTKIKSSNFYFIFKSLSFEMSKIFNNTGLWKIFSKCRFKIGKSFRQEENWILFLIELCEKIGINMIEVRVR